MKIKKINSTWLKGEGHRLDCGPFIGGAIDVKYTLEHLKNFSPKLSEVVSNRFSGIYHAGRYKRVWVNNKQYATPFLSSRDVMQSDLSKLNLISNKSILDNPKLLIHKDQILITRSGTVGRMSYVNNLMDGMSCTEHVIRVEADQQKVLSGYLYSFLNSKYGVPLIVSGTYGAVVRHIEPEHINDMPVPRVEREIESETDELIKSSAELRAEFQTKINQATDLLFESAGLKDITPFDWHNQGADIGFSVTLKNSRSIRALNFNSRYQQLVANLQSVEHKTLGDICNGGQLSSGARFKRIDASPEFGSLLIGQKQGFWAKPEGRWISAKHAPAGIFVKDETVMIASQGTLGEREVFARPILVTGKWLEYVYTQHFLRVYSNDPDVSGAYLFAFLRSETAFRCLRSMSIGSKQQDIHVGMLSELPIPIINDEDKMKVEILIREAFKAKDLADEKELKAIALVENAIDRAVN
ncbi:restriction endonuclease subunit S [Photobacterium phosphoreum]|uniref:methylation-associated defense system restriction endonuclease subunit S MAD5 n=1 Tax=Photobacterium phosphoreum TaxID=659 RepID=UPI001E5B4EA0|nr:hypothetical protein [Photobacterium phosphoreum]MCD9501969.1 restriction endonuclease subunit S [Photobacterium phosphoreum]